MTAKLLSIQTGRVQRLVMPENIRVDFRHPFWTSGIFKMPVASTIFVSREHVGDDAQADLENHGGPDNVVLAYDADHYPIWQKELQMLELPFGSFGENFTVSGFSEDTVCIGDTWRVGRELILQVTQPRQPCYKLARRLHQPHIVQKIHENSWGGWYLRVLKEGTVSAGMSISLVDRPHADWPVSEAVQVFYARKKNPAPALVLAQLPELSQRWKKHLAEDD